MLVNFVSVLPFLPEGSDNKFHWRCAVVNGTDFPYNTLIRGCPLAKGVTLLGDMHQSFTVMHLFTF